MNSRTKDETSWRAATRLVRSGTQRSEFFETSEALFMTSGYVYDSAEAAEQAFTGENPRYVYSRYANPTNTIFEQRLGAIEGAQHCLGVSSGMAAVFAAVIAPLKAGDRVVASRALFGSCAYVIGDLLPRYGIETEFVDGPDLDQWARALASPAAAVFLETPSNPTLELIDLQPVSDLAHAAGARVVVDNAFASPVLQRPMDFGADVVTYSATKHIDGQGRSLGGAVLTNDQDYFEEQLHPFVRHTGPSLSPFNAWLLLKGLETLELRVARQCENALEIAHHLETFSSVQRVVYPGLESHPQHALAARQMDKGGTMIAFELSGGKAGAFRALNRLKTIDISNNLGDAKSLITHPATTTHQRLSAEERARVGISDGLVRLSMGIEDVEDLKDDLDRALA